MRALIVALVFSATTRAAPSTTTLVGPGALDHQLTSAVGSFSVIGATVAAKDAWVFWDSAAAETDDGDIALDARRPENGEVGVVVRASWPGLDLEGLDGYLVAVRDGELRVERLDRGVATLLGAATVPVAHNVRLTVAMHGARLEALVAGAKVVVEDGGHRMGRVGLRARAAGIAPIVVEGLKLQRAQGVAEVPPSERIPSTDLRLVVVDDKDLSRIDPALRTWSTFKSRLASRPRTSLMMDTRQRSALLRSGVVPISVSSDVPWRAFAPASPGGAGGYLDVDGVEAALRGLAAAHPHVARVEEIGRSLKGRPLLALVIGDGASTASAEPAFLLNGAHHGSELMAVDSVVVAARWLLESRFTDDDAKRIVHDAETWCVPLVNPDGLAAFFDNSARAGRKNGRDVDRNENVDPWDGVDLNRNYPFQWGALGERASRRWPLHRFFRGEGAGSEPETQAMMRIARERRFVAAISFHTLSTALLAPYTVRGVRSPEPDVARTVAQDLVNALPAATAGQRAFKVGREIYAVDGTDQDWHRHENGTLAYILEGRRHNTLDVRVRAAIIHEERALWRGLMMRVLDGPTLRVSVRDVEGRPLDAVVAVDGTRTFQGERWRTRSLDGAYFLPLDAPRKLRVHAEADGCMSTSVDVAAGATNVEITLNALIGPELRDDGPRGSPVVP
ncbi:MAG: M14 family zinc carboxypeptidase [Deltaproteobacteria bacterium]|nr:M14 family zinc carboxypeptidase [Deltaproteobacteria bacterium]